MGASRACDRPRSQLPAEELGIAVGTVRTIYGSGPCRVIEVRVCTSAYDPRSASFVQPAVLATIQDDLFAEVARG